MCGGGGLEGIHSSGLMHDSESNLQGWIDADKGVNLTHS